MADTVLEQELETEFGDFGIDIEGNLAVLEKLCELCKTYHLESTDIVAQWMGFAVQINGGQDINTSALADFEKKKLLGSAKKALSAKKNLTPYRASPLSNTSKINKFDDNQESSVLDSYISTPNTHKVSKRLHTPDNCESNKRLASNNSTPIQQFTPSVLFSPAISTPSAKYEGRVGKGDVVLSHGISQDTSVQWKGCAESVSISEYAEVNVKKPYKHMFQKLQDKADILNDMISTLSSQIQQTIKLSEVANVLVKTEEEVVIAGRICCDSVGRLNSKSVLLEGSRESSAGFRVPLDLNEAKNYSLFPGQIVALHGQNVIGTKFLINDIHPGERLPFLTNSKKTQEPFTVYVACGPFATCDDKNLSYTPLEDLLSVIQEESPDVLIVLGPFVDAKQSLIENGDIEQTFHELFAYCCKHISDAAQKSKTEVLCVPSQRDIFHVHVYPQSPFQDSYLKMRMVSDPCTVIINNVCFGITSTDILFHMGSEEISSYTRRSDRLARLAEHLLLQQCYYPLHPTSEDVNLDYEQFERHAFMPVSPDVLIVPSDLRYFVKDIKGCFCVNPGRLVKGHTGGTYAKILIKQKKMDEPNKPSTTCRSIAQIVRI